MEIEAKMTATRLHFVAVPTLDPRGFQEKMSNSLLFYFIYKIALNSVKEMATLEKIPNIIFILFCLNIQPHITRQKRPHLSLA